MLFGRAINGADSSLGAVPFLLLQYPCTSRKQWGHADQHAPAPLLPLCLATGFQTAFAVQSECLTAPPIKQYCSCCFKGWGLTSHPVSLLLSKLRSHFQIPSTAANPVNISPVAGWTSFSLLFRFLTAKGEYQMDLSWQ